MRWLLLLSVLVACSSPAAQPPTGKLVVVLTMDWEGDDLSPENLDAITRLRRTLGPVPITHFVSAAYATKEHAPAELAALIASAVRPGDELAVHLHAWRSLAIASGLEPKVSPSFLSGTDNVLQLGNNDIGFDTDLDAYDVAGLRALLRTSRKLLEPTHVRISNSFRAGGYLGSPKLLLALGDEGFEVDSSAIDPRELHDLDDIAWQPRLAQLWPRVEASTQPYLLRAGPTQLMELPIAAVIDYASTAEIVAAFETAHAVLLRAPDHDAFVVVAFHLETLSDFAQRLTSAIETVRANPALAGRLVYTTIEVAAERARFAL